MNINLVTDNDETEIISTKANTRKAMSTLLKESFIEEMYVFVVKEFLSKKEAVIERVKNQFAGQKIVVRSSSTNEDCFRKSNAGHYTSILDVDSADSNDIESAIEAVIKSYEKDIIDIGNEQILIQHQAVDVAYSGVLFTYDIQGKRPYYLINYDDRGSTDSVTSGRGGKTLWIARNVDISHLEVSWCKLLKAVKEIELYLNIALDIEFAINKNNEVIIFQVRPLV
ncbi:MAG: sugar metabolism cluster protein, partial [Lachnospiraceae bacterium]|nr:sugar metabolism cluster protein [Lachnospiraceae bacterium]